MIVEKLGGEMIFRNHTNFGKPLFKPSRKRKSSCNACVYSKEEGKTASMKQDIIDMQVENFSSKEALGALDRLRSRSFDDDSWKDYSSDAKSQGLSVVVKFPLIDLSDKESCLGDDGLDMRSKSLVSFGNFENDYFQ